MRRHSDRGSSARRAARPGQRRDDAGEAAHGVSHGGPTPSRRQREAAGGAAAAAVQRRSQHRRGRLSARSRQGERRTAAACACRCRGCALGQGVCVCVCVCHALTYHAMRSCCTAAVAVPPATPPSQALRSKCRDLTRQLALATTKGSSTSVVRSRARVPPSRVSPRKPLERRSPSLSGPRRGASASSARSGGGSARGRATSAGRSASASARRRSTSSSVASLASGSESDTSHRSAASSRASRRSHGSGSSGGSAVRLKPFDPTAYEVRCCRCCTRRVWRCTSVCDGTGWAQRVVFACLSLVRRVTLHRVCRTAHRSSGSGVSRRASSGLPAV